MCHRPRFGTGGVDHPKLAQWGGRTGTHSAPESHSDRLLARYDIPGAAIAVVQEGRLEWSASFGHADLETDAPLQIGAVFQVASISKPVTALGVMRLVERGAVSLDEPVFTYRGGGRLPQSSFDHNGEPRVARRLRALAPETGDAIVVLTNGDNGASLISAVQAVWQFAVFSEARLR